MVGFCFLYPERFPYLKVELASRWTTQDFNIIVHLSAYAASPQVFSYWLTEFEMFFEACYEMSDRVPDIARIVARTFLSCKQRHFIWTFLSPVSMMVTRTWVFAVSWLLIYAWYLVKKEQDWSVLRNSYRRTNFENLEMVQLAYLMNFHWIGITLLSNEPAIRSK